MYPKMTDFERRDATEHVLEKNATPAATAPSPSMVAGSGRAS